MSTEALLRKFRVKIKHTPRYGKPITRTVEVHTVDGQSAESHALQNNKGYELNGAAEEVTE